MNKDIVYLIWKEPKSGDKYKVAEIYKEDKKYYFRYIQDEVKKAMENGFALLVAFPSVNATYENEQLFPVLSARLPDKRRPEIDRILAEYGMQDYDEFELLKRSGAKLPTDNYEFAI